MTKSFDADLLSRLARVEEVQIETQRAADAPVHRTIIWVVVAGNDVYVRSVRGASARWYREMRANPTGALHVEGQRIPVRAVPATDADSVARASAEYQRKYGKSPFGPAMVRDEILETTIRLEPAH
jgi:hypothetical protein